ncbi:MAG: hypothetical protein WCK81_14515, partial [Betaproteobacteria bacterium]
FNGKLNKDYEKVFRTISIISLRGIATSNGMEYKERNFITKPINPVFNKKEQEFYVVLNTCWRGFVIRAGTIPPPQKSHFYKSILLGVPLVPRVGLSAPIFLPPLSRICNACLRSRGSNARSNAIKGFPLQSLTLLYKSTHHPPGKFEKRDYE